MTSAWWTPDRIWQLAACALLVAGFAALGWALFRDRARGRRRCPKCWYDMSGAFAANGAGPWTCPECGKSIVRERHLRRDRRDWRYVPVAVFLFVLAYAAAQVPAVRAHGWPAALPDLALAEFAPIEANQWTAMPVGGGQNFLMPTGRCVVEIQRRMNGEGFSASASRVFFGRLFMKFPDQAGSLVQTRPAWPAGEHIYARLSVPWMLWSQRANLIVRARLKGRSDWVATPRGGGNFQTVDLGPAPSTPGDIDLEAEVLQLHGASGGADPLAGAAVLYSGVLMHIDVLAPDKEVMQAVAGQKFDAAILSDVKPEVVMVPDVGPVLRLVQQGWHIGGEADGDWALACRAELVQGERVLASTNFVYSMVSPGMFVDFFGLHTFEPMQVTSGVDLGAVKRPMTLRITGDRRAALRDISRSAYWSGTLLIPVESIRSLPPDDREFADWQRMHFVE